MEPLNSWTLLGLAGIGSQAEVATAQERSDQVATARETSSTNQLATAIETSDAVETALERPDQTTTAREGTNLLAHDVTFSRFS